MCNKRFVLYAIFTIALLLTTSLTVGAASVPLISTDDLKSRLGEADLVVLDVRGSWDLVKSDNKIAGSERVEPGAAKQWAKNYPKEKMIVLYCA